MADKYYLNEDHSYTPCDLMTWAEQFEHMDRHVGNDMVNDHHVSTVWLGLNHAYRDNCKPLLFETMVFDKSGSDIFMNRYSTWDEAAIGHAEAINWVKQRGEQEQLRLQDSEGRGTGEVLTLPILR